MADEEYNYRCAKWAAFFNDFEQYLKAFVTNENSIHVEDAVRFTEIRREFIENLASDRYNLR
jgi:hypothetical protein